MSKLNEKKLRQDFPIFKKLIYGKPLVYLDNAATTQKPNQVLDAEKYFYTEQNANIHRGLYYLANQADVVYEKARAVVQNFINAKEQTEIVFTSGATAAINLVAQSYGQSHFENGEIIISSLMEHHSNIVPWQLIGARRQNKLIPTNITEKGELDLEHYAELLKLQPKLVAICHVSNVLGTVNPIKKMIKMAHAVGALVLVDGSQAVANLSVDVQDLDCDFYVFSGHKIYAPTGIGVLYAKKAILEKMPPYQGGGGMITSVDFSKTEFSDLPARFEAGTPNIAGAIGLAAAINYLKKLGMENIEAHSRALRKYTLAQLTQITGIKIIGMAADAVGVISFVLAGVHPHDIGTVLDREGIAIRAGHHCAMPLMHYFDIPATTRVSFGVYNTRAEVEVLISAIKKVKSLFNN